MPIPEREHWVDLAPWWERIEQFAHAVAADKAGLPSGRFWTADEDTHLPGFAGEVGFAALTGRKVNTAIRREGDDGWDFVDEDGIRIDVKATTNCQGPVSLFEAPEPKAWADVYVLMVVDIAGRRAGYVGWQWGGALRQAPLVSKKAGVPARHCLPERELYRPLYLRPEKGSEGTPGPRGRE